MLTVVFLAAVRERAGCEQLSVDWQPGMTLASLRQLLAGRNEALAEALSEPLLMARNHAMATPETLLQEGDEVAFFPPVTGG